jgi:hypothetical protein
MLLKEYRYVTLIGSHMQFLNIHELISGAVGWGGPFRLLIPADSYGEEQTIYGASHQEVAQKGHELLTRRLGGGS